MAARQPRPRRGRDSYNRQVGDSGAVIATATHSVAAVLPTLANTRKSLEVDRSAGVPVATSTRSGVGMVG
jgi:hypothetical protein